MIDRRRCLNGHLEVGLRDSALHEWKSAGANVHACVRAEFHGGAGDCFVSERKMSGQIPSREGGSVEKVGLHAGKKNKDEHTKELPTSPTKELCFRLRPSLAWQGGCGRCEYVPFLRCLGFGLHISARLRWLWARCWSL